MQKTRALLEAQLRGLTEDNEQLREDLAQVTREKEDAINLAVKAWEEHRFAVLRIGDLNGKLGAMVEVAKQACEIVRAEEREAVVKFLKENWALDRAQEIENGEHVSIPR